VTLSAATTEDIQLFWFCVNANPNGNCDNLQAPCDRSCYPSSGGSDSSSGTDTGSGSSSGSITISQKSGSNQWWYAVTVTASSGLTVTGLKMKGNGQWSWEEGVAEWDYYKFTANAPYSAPLSFQVTLSTGQVVEGQVISAIADGSSGTLSVSAAYTAEDSVSDNSSHNMSSSEIAVVAICSVLALCVLSALCFVYYRKRNKVIAAGVDDDEVIADEKDGGYDMTTIGNGDGQKTEAEIMIDVQVTETKQ